MKANEIGSRGENFAKEYLILNGYNIVATNFHSKYGEIDIIAEIDRYIVFVEVKTRKISSLVSPAEAVTRPKQNKIIKTAFVYLESTNIDKQPRFDVIEVTFENKNMNINHIKNAFYQEEDYASF